MSKPPAFKKMQIHLKNADVEEAEGITHYLYQMIEDRELEWVSIENVKKSPNSIEVFLLAVVSFGLGYLGAKAIDPAYERAKEKILDMLKKWKNRSQTKLDVFFDDKKMD